MPSKKGSSKSKKGDGSSVFDFFSQKQVAEFKEGFQLMDKDKDGVIGKDDLRAVHDDIGRMVTEKDIDEMLADGENHINFTTLLHMFATRSSGETDEDDVVEAGFRAFEKSPGLINAENFRTMLMSFGDRFTAKEVDEAFEQLEYDEDANTIDSDAVVAMLCAGAAKEQPADAPAE